jgi:hypothetical protein
MNLCRQATRTQGKSKEDQQEEGPAERGAREGTHKATSRPIYRHRVPHRR